MMKNLMCVMLVVCVAMTATTFGAATAVQDGDWNDPATWGQTTPDPYSPSGSIYITGGETVTVTAPATGGAFTRVYNNSHLIINADLTLTDDLVIQSGSTVTMNAGYLELAPEKLKIAEGTGTGAFIMNGGTTYLEEDLELFDSGLLEFNGGSFTLDVPLEFMGGTIRVVGDAASLIDFDSMQDGGTGSIYEFNPNAAGGITPITSGNIKAGELVVDCNDITVAGIITMTLFQSGSVDAFDPANVTITKDGTPLVEDLDGGSLGENEYSLDYNGTGLALSVNLPGEVDPCHAAKTAGYDEEDARIIGDTNFDCNVNLDDLAAMALNWMTHKTL